MSQNNTHHNRTKRVCLLKGGWNGERDVSLQSAQGVHQALVAKGYDVVTYDLIKDIKALVLFLEETKPDVVFVNALHGHDVEDGKLQSVLEIIGLPYTGSDVSSSAVAFDKQLSRTVLAHHGIPLSMGRVFNVNEVFTETSFQVLCKTFGSPFVTKPLCEGSSLGVSIVHNEADLKAAKQSWSYGDRVLVETYIPGRELSVALLGGKPLGILELQPSKLFYDYEAKYTDGVTKHIMPAVLDPKEQDLLMSTASKVARLLGVNGVTRVDFRYDDSRPAGQRHFVLELNSLPGMTPLSIVPEIAAYSGMSYEALCEWMVENPICPQ